MKPALVIALVFLLLALAVQLSDPPMNRKAGLYMGDKQAVRMFYQGRLP